MDRTSPSRAWLEAPHKQICDQGGSPQVSLRTKPKRKPRGLPNRNPLQTQGLPTSSQGSSSQAKLCATNLQAELRPGGLPTSRITTRELAGWLAGGIATREPAAGWLVEEAQRGPKRGGPERPKEAERGWNKPAMRLVGSSHKQIYDQGHRFLYGTPEETPHGLLDWVSKQKSTSNPVPPHKQNYVCMYVCMLCTSDQEAPHKQNYDREVELRPGR